MKKNNLFAIIFGLLLFLPFIFSNSVQAEEKETYQVDGDNVNVREEPDADAAVVTTLSKGDEIVVFDEQYGWLQTYIDGEVSWIAEQHLFKADKETESEESNEEDTASEAADSSEQEASSSKGSLEGKNIMLDAGHGGKDPGTIALNDEKEKTLSLKYTKSLKEQLENQGATVILTRENDRYLSLNERVAASESYNTDAFVSIHFNAFTSEENHGASTHFFDEGDDQELAQSIQSELTSNTDFKDRGVKQDDYYVLRKNEATSVLAELGFLSNEQDLEAIQDEEHMEQVTQSITNGLEDYFQ